MDINIILGIIILCFAYGFLVYLVLWSRRTIDVIDKNHRGSLREIKEDLKLGK